MSNVSLEAGYLVVQKIMFYTVSLVNSTFSSFRAKDLKLREFFEKQFPELKKQREDRERISRVSQRIRSDAEWEEIIDGLQEQEVCLSCTNDVALVCLKMFFQYL